ncbi:MAG: polyribonucleotide nucleotidyltransferase [Brevinematales bacterium]
MSFVSVSKKIGEREIIIETGKMAKQADGAVLVKEGKNAVLVTACMSDNVPDDVDFFPLTVQYQEKFYAAGKIPGGYIKREGKPSEKEILVSRLIDRPIRPLFPENFKNEVQVIATTFSADQVYSTDVLGIIGASASLAISRIPFLDIVGGVRIAYKDGNFIINPSIVDVDDALLDIVVAGTRRGITMVEGGSKEVSPEILLKALDLAEENIIKVIELIEELVEKIKPEKYVVPEKELKLEESKRKEIWNYSYEAIKAVNVNPDKKKRKQNIEEAFNKVLENFGFTKESEEYSEVKAIFEDVEVNVVRDMILNDGVRPDGRKYEEIRPITIDLDLLENVHGSAMFTRGQTQSLAIVTLGTSSDVQYVDSIEESEPKRFMLHYNFPPFSTGEVKKVTSTSRREIGHGHLAQRAIEPILPDESEFPYTIRIVSEVLESNGSSSMATVCSSSLALMCTGVPVKKNVAGIAMGLVWDNKTNKFAVLSDIQGVEDHYGDMDFKVAGTRDGINAFQMDVKTVGLPREILKVALEQAWKGKEYILDKMEAAISTPRGSLSANAPKIKVVNIPVSEIGNVIGPGGRVIKKIMAETEVTISIEDDGKVMISGKDSFKIDRAAFMVEHIANGFKVGELIEGKVVRIEDYGVFVELIPGTQGLLHRSNFKEKKQPKDFFKIGDAVNVKIIDIDEKKRISLSQV